MTAPVTVQKPMKCPSCHNGHVGSILYRMKDDTYGCRLCGHRWSRSTTSHVITTVEPEVPNAG